MPNKLTYILHNLWTHSRWPRTKAETCQSNNW